MEATKEILVIREPENNIIGENIVEVEKCGAKPKVLKGRVIIEIYANFSENEEGEGAFNFQENSKILLQTDIAITAKFFPISEKNR